MSSGPSLRLPARRTGSDKKEKKSDYALWHVSAGAFITGAVMAAYILLLNLVNQSHPSRAPVKDAALISARELRQIAVHHPSFGLVGLVDAQTEGELEESEAQDHHQGRIRSLNSVKAAILSSLIVARKLNDPTMEEHIRQDLESLEAIESQILERLRLAINGEGPGTTSGSVYRAVRKEIERGSPTNLLLKEVKIQLGLYRGKDVPMVTSICPPSQLAEQANQQGQFKNDIPVATCADNKICFHQTAARTQLFDSANFLAAAPGVTPSAVLVEAHFQSKDAPDKASEITKQSCATLGTEQLAPGKSCLVLRFPHGVPSQFRTTRDLHSRSYWSQKGEWQQANGGSVPGDGLLQPTLEPVLPAMDPGEALSICLYHWMRQMHPAPDPEAVLAMLDTKLVDESAVRPTQTRINSCLVQDTGARERAFIKGTGPRSEGQKALMSCFAYSSNESEFPQEAVPLYVDSNGKLNLSGVSGFDMPLIQKYLDAVYDTNMAAMESLAMTNALVKKVHAELQALEHSLPIKEQANVSLANQLERLTRDTGAKQETQDKVTGELERVRSQLATSKTEVELLKDRRHDLKTVVRLAKTAKNNANAVAMRTFEVSSSNLALLKGGLHAFDPPVEAFLLGRKEVFFPITKPVRQEDFFEHARWERRKEGSHDNPWLQPTVKIIAQWKNAFDDETSTTPATISGKPLSTVLAEVESLNEWHPLTVVFDADELTKKAIVTAHRTPDYPFNGLPVPAGQTFFFCKQATTTGENNSVVWSVAMRDAVSHRNKGEGLPIRTMDGAWGHSMVPAIAESPGLAIEFQLRRPLPANRLLPSGETITDPVYGRKIWQIPPVPGSMM